GRRDAGLPLRRRGARAGPRRPTAAPGAAALLLEEREVAARAPVPRPRPARLLGAPGVLEQRRPMEGGALRLLSAALRRTTSTRSSGGRGGSAAGWRSASRP